MSNTSTASVVQSRGENPHAAIESATPFAGPKRITPRMLAVAAVVVLALAAALTEGLLVRSRQKQQVDTAAAQAAAAPPRVTVAAAEPRPADATRLLPGNSMPLMEAGLFARTTGYVSKRLVDIGDRVRAGELLAVISAPDVDDQLAQARANLSQAIANLPLTQANLDLAKITLRRDTQSGVGSAFSVQQIDQDKAQVKTTAAQVDVAKATIEVNQATVQRFTDLQGFQQITAPFQGVITARNIEVGDLIPADSPSTTREMFHIMRTDVLRVFVNVPQVFATGIKLGQSAAVYVRDQPQKQYPGKVTRTANALDPNTRTLLVEVDVPNPNDALRPGMYLEVKFVFGREVVSVMIPAAALATRTTGPRVGVLDAEHRVHYRSVDLGRDYGAQIEVLSGLSAGETVVVHPGDDLPEGTVVEPVPLPK